MNTQKPFLYVTTYCNKAHRMSDGKPVAHNCYVIPPKALELEYVGDYQRAIDVINSAKPLREMARGVKAPTIVPPTDTAKNDVKPVCPNCGSDDISAETSQRWSVLSQSWEPTIHDHHECHSDECDGMEIYPEWVPVAQ
jgi:hypothetical protein